MSRNEKGQFTKGNMRIDLTGHRFGKLKVLRIDEQRTNEKHIGFVNVNVEQ